MAVVTEGAVLDTSPVDSLGEISIVAPGRAVPSHIICKKARLTHINTQASRVVSVL
jgi:hypothetical protein